MKNIKITFIALCIICVSQLHAQKGTIKVNLQYSYAVPLESFKNNIVSSGSPRGVTGDFLYNLNNKLSLGLGLGFQDYYQKYPRALYKTGDNETTSAVLSNSVQIIPVLAKAEWNPLAGGKSFIQPYVSLGAGVGFSNFEQYLGEFGGTDNKAGFAFQGGAGIAIPFSVTHASGFRIGANYNMLSYKQNGFDNLNNINFQAGIYFPLR